MGKPNSNNGGWGRYLKRDFVIPIVVTAVVSSAITCVVERTIDLLSPVDPKIEAYINQLNKAQEKDEWMIELARQTTGNADSQTVARVKSELVSYLGHALTGYPTREEFAREKHRFIDKVKGVVWETKVEDGNMSMYTVGPWTNNTTSTLPKTRYNR